MSEFLAPLISLVTWNWFMVWKLLLISLFKKWLNMVNLCRLMLSGLGYFREFVDWVHCIKILYPQEVQQMRLDGDIGNSLLQKEVCNSVLLVSHGWLGKDMDIHVKLSLWHCINLCFIHWFSRPKTLFPLRNDI